MLQEIARCCDAVGNPKSLRRQKKIEKADLLYIEGSSINKS